MENVSVTIAPIRVVHLVGTVELHWFLANFMLKIDQICALAVASIMDLTLCGLQVHLVGIDDLGFFLEIESALMVLCEGTFALKLFLVVAVSFGGVWVADKSIVAPRLPPVQVVSNRHLFNFRSGIR